MKKKIVVAIYTRVSTQDQAEEGYSIQEQKERLEKYAEAQNWCVYKWYNDPGVSGGTMDRAGLQALIADANKKKFNKVIVHKLDRLSRSQKDTLYLIEDVFLKNGIDFVSMTETFDTGTPFGIAMVGLLAVFSQLEKSKITERMQIGLDARAKEGLFHGGGWDPIGYDYIDGQLITNDYEALQIKKIYELFFSGMPIHSITKYMNEHYKGHKHGAWADSGIRSVLTSILYIGKITWKGEIYDGQHTALVSDADFYKAAKMFEARSKNTKYREHPFKRTSLLGGLIWCGRCGARYYCKQNVSKNPETTPAQKYYTCYSRGKSTKKLIKDPNCKNKSWNTKNLDSLILEEIRKLYIDPDTVDNMINADKGEDTSANDREVIISRIEAIDNQVQKLIDLYSLGKIDYGVIAERIEKLSDEKETLEAELNSIVIVTPDLSVSDTKEILKTVPEILASADKEQQRTLVHSLINAIIIKGEDLEIHWKFL